jgi:hypothetical protein
VTDVRKELEGLLGREGVGTMRVPAIGDRPAACPASEEEVSATIRLAARRGWRVLPAGNGSKLGWTALPADVELVLSTRRLSGLVAYEPGDGTLTARAGATMAERETGTARGRNHLTPRVPAPAGATLGGVLAAGQNGVDRLRFGPARHHVLGMRAALADGTTAKSGGRLVKNVTGYDLHRLYCGSAGSLCAILEVTLRLFAGFEVERVFSIATEDRSRAFRVAASIEVLRLDPVCIRCENVLDTGGAWRVHVHLAGREVVLEAARRALVSEHPDSAEGVESPERIRDAEIAPGRPPEMRVSGRPSRIAEGLDRLPTGTRMVVDPAVASAAVFVDPASLETAAGILAGAGLSVAVAGRRDVLPERSDLASELALRLKRSFDPGGLFAGGTSRARL